ncbi:MAG: hypothetical protein LBT88_02295 [Oscillospiraceae bacterium]|nr:hypothetical protein [Oscillospiraceae bacterium]
MLTPSPLPAQTSPSEPAESAPNDTAVSEVLGFSGGNIGAGGLMGGDADWIYYRSEAEATFWQLCKARPDGTDKSRAV